MHVQTHTHGGASRCRYRFCGNGYKNGLSINAESDTHSSWMRLLVPVKHISGYVTPTAQGCLKK